VDALDRLSVADQQPDSNGPGGPPGVIRGAVPLYIEIEGPSRGRGYPGTSGVRDDDPSLGEEQ
jgi:hypothetical protein